MKAKIRVAKAEDIPVIVALGRRFLLEGPYHEIMPDNPKVATELAEKLANYPGAKILVAEADGKIVGVFAFLLFPHYYSGVMTAGELIWYVEPEYRAGNTGLELKWAAEKMAKELGAEQMHLTCPPDQEALFSKLHGYVRVEVGWQRRL